MSKYYLVGTTVVQVPNELYHHGVKGMKWGIRKKEYITTMGSRKKSKNDDVLERKRRIDADIKEADDRVKFYGSKRAAKAAIKDEASYVKKQNRGKAFVDTLIYGGTTGVATGLVGGLATTAAGGLIFGAAPIAIAAGVTAALATRANNIVRKHANDQIHYTDESAYGHDIVVALKEKD